MLLDPGRYGKRHGQGTANRHVAGNAHRELGSVSPTHIEVWVGPATIHPKVEAVGTEPRTHRAAAGTPDR